MKEIGLMTKKQLDKLFSTCPPSAVIFKGRDIATVRNEQGRKLISAAKTKGGCWHVMAEESIVEVQSL